jgi:peptidase M16 inactive domain protein
LMFEEPRFEKPQFDKYVERAKYMYENRRLTPQDLVQDSIRKLTTRTDERNRDLGAAYFDKMNFDRLEPLYRECFSNAKEFTFCIVGDIDREEAVRLTNEYIGSLPSRKGKKEEYIIRNYDVGTDTISHVFTVAMPGDKGMVNLMLENNAKFSDKEQLALNIWGQMLRNRLFAIVREQESATYGVNVEANSITFPYRKATMMIGFETQRDKVERMKEMIYKELDRSQHELFTQEELTPILVSIKLSRSQADENIGIDYWMNVLNTYAEYGEDVTDHSDKLLEGMTVEDVRDVVWKFLKKVKVRDWVIKSEEADPLSDWEK